MRQLTNEQTVKSLTFITINKNGLNNLQNYFNNNDLVNENILEAIDFLKKS